MDGGGLARSDLTYAMVTHGTSADPFWSVVSNRAQDAARDLAPNARLRPRVVAFGRPGRKGPIPEAVATSVDPSPDESAGPSCPCHGSPFESPVPSGRMQHRPPPRLPLHAAGAYLEIFVHADPGPEPGVGTSAEAVRFRIQGILTMSVPTGRPPIRGRAPASLLTLLLLAATPALAQNQVPWSPLDPGSDNIEVLGHLPLGPRLSVADLDMEQELDRPYAYVSRMVYGDEGPKGTDIIDISDPASPRLIYEWRIEDQDLHQRTGGMDVKHFKWDGRYYVVQSLQFGQGGPDSDLGAVVLDVTGLPDPDRVREVARIREPELPPGGFHNIFVYKHSNGRVLLFTTVQGPFAHVYDLGRVVEGDLENALVARVPVPENEANQGDRGYHDFYVGYHPDTGTDRFYGGGTGGYYVYDITDLQSPELLVTLVGISGVPWGHTFTPGPRGRYVVAETEYQYAPLRIFDLEPALAGDQTNISSPISAWTADWRNLTHNHEMRWPYVFVSGYLDGLQVFSLMDPQNPETVAYYDTYLGPPNTDRYAVFNGAFGVDVRNADGLIVVSDMSTGFWTFRMEGFNGWSGEQWGVPDVSSAQKWDEPLPRVISQEGGGR